MALTRIDIRGRDGRSLKEDWARDLRTTDGVAVPAIETCSRPQLRSRLRQRSAT